MCKPILGQDSRTIMIVNIEILTTKKVKGKN